MMYTTVISKNFGIIDQEITLIVKDKVSLPAYYEALQNVI